MTPGGKGGESSWEGVHKGDLTIGNVLFFKLSAGHSSVHYILYTFSCALNNTFLKVHSSACYQNLAFKFFFLY